MPLIELDRIFGSIPSDRICAKLIGPARCSSAVNIQHNLFEPKLLQYTKFKRYIHLLTKNKCLKLGFSSKVKITVI